MVDLGVVVTWIAISAASAKGLSAFARAAAMSDTETEPTAFSGDSGSAYDRQPHTIDVSPRLLRESA